jgi:hypothetical protein
VKGFGRYQNYYRDALDKPGGLRPRQAEAAVDDVGQVRTRQSVCGVRLIGDPRDPEIGHDYLPPQRRAPAVSITLS